MTPSDFEQVFFSHCGYRNFIQVAKAATGKMYKRGTFDDLALHSEVVSGLLRQKF